MKKITLLLAATMALSTAATADFSDTAGHWASEYIEYCAENGVMTGVSDSEFMPDERLSVAQAIAAVVKLDVAYNGGTMPVQGSPWYSSYCEYLDNLGINYPSDMQRDCSREEFFALLTAVIDAPKFAEINSIRSVPDVTDEDILALYKAGIISGMNEYGTFYGSLSITRAECAAIYTRILDYTKRVEFTLTKGDDSEAMQRLFMPSDMTAVTISNTEISAEIYTAYLSHQIDVKTATKQMQSHPEYERYFTMWNTGTYLGDFERYLSEIHGVNDYDPTDFSASDAEIRKAALDELNEYVALIELTEKYNCSLTDEQNEAIELFASSSKFSGDSRVIYSKCIMEKNLMLENLAEKKIPSENKIISLLATGENLVAEYIRFSKTDEFGKMLDDSAIDYLRAGAELFRLEILESTGHYRLEFMAKEFKTEYTGLYPTIYNVDSTDNGLWKTLEKLTPKGVSAVMEDDKGIYIYLVENPSADSTTMELVRENYGRDLAKSELSAYIKTLKANYTPETLYVSINEFVKRAV